MQQRDETVSDSATVDILGYFRSVLRYWLVGAIVFVVVAALGGFWALSGGTTSTQRSIHLALDPGLSEQAAQSTDYSGSVVMLMRTYTNLADSPVILEATKANLGSDSYTVEQLAEMTEFYAGGGSFLMRIDVKAATTEEADKVANAYAKAWIDNLTKVSKAPAPFHPTLAMVEPPFDFTSNTTTAAAAPQSPMRKLATVIAGALVLGVVAMAVTEAAVSAIRRRKLADQVLVAQNAIDPADLQR